MERQVVCSYVPDNFLEKSAVQEKLGEGTYGTVFRIRTFSGDTYAVKYLPFSSDIHNPGVSQSGLLDADALVRLRKLPDIIQMIGICNSPGYLSIILEAMDSNLKTFIEKTPQEERLRLLPHFLHTLIRTAALMEAFNISHFDLKPQNILVRAGSSGPEFKITDFGLSRVSVKGHYVPQSELFSMWYRPPEFLAERPRESFRIFAGDIWSIGVTAIEFVIGYPAFGGSSNKGVLRQIYEMTPLVNIMTNRVFDNANKNGTITGGVDVPRLIQFKGVTFQGPIDQVSLRVITQALMLNPDQRPTANELLAQFSDSISPLLLASLLPQPVHHRVDIRSIELIIQLGYTIRVSLATIIISIELLTRYLEKHEGEISDKYALAAFRIGSSFNEDRPPATEKIRETYLFKRSLQQVSLEEIVQAEKTILNRVQYEIYNMNLNPVITRAYQQNIDLDYYNLDLFSNPLELWFV